MTSARDVNEAPTPKKFEAEPTVAREVPKSFLQKMRRREDESGVQFTDRQFTRKPLRPMNITPEVDALGYDPFEDQPTLVHGLSWRASMMPNVDIPLSLVRRKKPQTKSDWLASLPEAARAVLLTAAKPVDTDAPRIAGAIAQPRQE